MIGIALVSFVAVLGHGLRDLDDRLAGEGSSGRLRARGPGRLVEHQPRLRARDRVGARREGRHRRRPRTRSRRSARRPTSTASIPRSRPCTAPTTGTGPTPTCARSARTAPSSTEDYANDHHLSVGERFTAITSAGRPLHLQVRAVSARRPSSTRSAWVRSRSRSRPSTPASAPARSASRSSRSTAAPTRRPPPALKARIAAFPDAKLQSKDVFAKDQSAWVDQVLAILYVLLALAVVCSMFGMVNTLVLSVFERTRELGLLRAVGMSRRQVRRMVRHESIITALIGRQPSASSSACSWPRR